MSTLTNSTTFIDPVGDSLIIGTSGNDTFEGGAGNDSIDGSTGFDMVRYGAAIAGVNVNLATGIALDGYGGTDELTSIELVWGSSHNDVLIGGSPANGVRTSTPLDGFEGFQGLAGNDTIDGGAGFDRVYYTDSPNAVNVTLGGTSDGSAQDGWGGVDTLRSIEEVRGSQFADTLTGSDSGVFESFEGRAGNDLIDGKGGTDQITFNTSPSAVFVDMQQGVAYDGFGGTDQFKGIEMVWGSAYNDVLIGGNPANGVRTTTPIDGFEGFQGFAGNDTIDGGAGFDRAYYSDSPNAVNVTLGGTSDGTAQDGWGDVDTLRSIEEVRGSQFADTLTGSDSGVYESFEGRAGNDLIDGKGGTDRISFDTSPNAVTVDIQLGVASDGFGGTDQFTGIEEVRGSAFNDNLFGSGNESLNPLTGARIAEVFEGRAGSDYIDGRGGLDVAVYSAASAGIVANLATGVVQDGYGSTDTLVNIEGLYGSIHNDVLTGGNSANENLEYFRSDAGNDTVDGGSGFDRVDFNNSPSGVVVTLGGYSDGSAQDGFGNFDVLRNIEAARGSEQNDRFIGSSRNTYSVDNYVEVFYGLAGDDTLDGSAGAIVVADYVFSTQAVTVNLLTGTAQDGHGGTDTLISVAGVRGSKYADSLIGDGLNNGFTGRGGNDTIDGGAGNDITRYEGSRDQYLIQRNNDDSYTVIDMVANRNGTDTLRNIEQISFDGVNRMLDLQLTAGNSSVVKSAVIDGNKLVVTFRLEVASINMGSITFKKGNGSDLVTLAVPSVVLNGSVAELVFAVSFGSGDYLLIDDIRSSNSQFIDVSNQTLPLFHRVVDGIAIGGPGDTLINLSGLSGVYEINDEAGNNVLQGNNANNLFFAGVGNDTFEGGAGSDYIDGNAGYDMVRYGAALAGVNVNLATGIAQDGYGGTDELKSIELVWGSSYNDVLIGGNPANGVRTSSPIDGFEGFQGFAGNDTIDGGAGFDRVYYSDSPNAVNVTLGGTSDGTAQDGWGGVDTLRNIEEVRGSQFADSLTGSDSGAFESFEGRAGNDTINGYGGTDRISFITSPNAVFVDMQQGFATDGFGGTDQFTGIEMVWGSSYNDVLIGGNPANGVRTSSPIDGFEGFQGFSGNDTIDGGAGFDRVYYSDSPNAVNVTLGGTADGTVQDGWGGVDTLRSIEEVRGSQFADTLTGSDSGVFESFEGLAGNDTINGNGGTDRISFDTSPNAVTVDIQQGLASDGFGGTDQFTGIEEVRGSAFDDTLLGSGNDRLNPLTGARIAEVFEGRAGNDYIDGRGGLDLVLYSAATAGIVANLATGVVQDGYGSTDTILNIEGLYGSTHNDVLTGGNSVNDSFEFFRSDAGNDTVDGGSGFDRVDFNNSPSGVVVTLGGYSDGSAQDGFGNIDVLRNIEAARGSEHNDRFVGSNRNTYSVDNYVEVFYGLAGDDTLDGSAGAIVVADYLFSTQAVTVNLLTGTAQDGHGGTDTLISVPGVRGSKYADSLIGDGLSNGFTGRGGNDTIDGGGGNDFASYEGSRDQYLIQRNYDNSYTVTDMVANRNGTDTLRNIEQITFDGGNQRLDLQLTAGNNSAVKSAVIAGNKLVLTFHLELASLNIGSITFKKGNGSDLVTLAAPSVVVNGSLVELVFAVSFGSGDYLLIDDIRTSNSQLIDGNNQTQPLFYRAIDGIVIGGLDDTLINLSGLSGVYEVFDESGKNVLLGNNSNNLIKGGTGNDTINGSGGNDELYGNGGDDFFINASNGNDTILGGDGQDVVFYEDATSAVQVDLVNQTASGGAGQDVLIGIEGVHGSAFGDTIILSGSGYVFGRSGADTLISAPGTGNWFNPGSGNDTIVGGSAGFDWVEYQDDGFDQSGPATQGAVINLALGTATDAWGNQDTLSGIEGVGGSQFADQIIGSAGNDTFEGRAGNDTIDGGAGNDSIDGGAGNDFVRYVAALAGVNVNLATGIAQDGYGGTDELISVELVWGSTFNDVLIGGNPASGVRTSSPIDGFEGFQGYAGNDTIDGGAGFDRAYYSNSPNAVNVTLGGTADGTAQDGWGGVDTLRSIEEVRGSQFADTFTGSDSGVFESFEGRAGNDTINGNGGTDRISFDTSPNAVTVDIQQGLASDGFGGTDQFTGIEEVRGSAFNDTLLGSGNDSLNPLTGARVAEVFEGRAGSDYIDGRGGLDLAVYSAATAGIVANMATGVAQDGDGSTDTLVNIEGLYGSVHNDVLTGGNTANDNFEFFRSDAGNDTVDGGSGFDRVDFNNSPNGVVVTLGGYSDGSAQDGFGNIDVLRNIEAARGSEQNDRFIGSNRNTYSVDNYVEVFYGLAGNDTIDGSAGATVVADYRFSTQAVTVNLLTGTAQDGHGGTDTLISVAGVRGSKYADSLIGDGLNNGFTGRDGNDTIDGGGGVDKVVFTGLFSEYSFEQSGSWLTVSDSVADRDGIDQLNNIQLLQFADQTINSEVLFGLLNSAPSLQPLTGLEYFDTASSDLFSGANGQMIASDSDGDSLIFGLVGASVLSGAASLQGLYGSLVVNASTGAWTYTPNAVAMQALDSNASESFTLTVSDGLAVTTQTLAVNINATVDIPTLTSKYFLLAGSGANHVDYQLKASPLSLQGQFISQAGTTGVDTIHVRAGSAIDFTASGASADKIYLDGAYGDYGVSLTGAVMTLYRGSGASRELVRVVRGTSLVSSDLLVFADGSVSTWDLFNLLKSGTQLPNLGSETTQAPLGAAAPGSTLSATIKAFALDSSGETFASVGQGMKLTAVGSVGVDTVYVSDGSTVDATLLGASSDLIYLRGNWGDYSKSVAGSVMTFSRLVSGQTESVKVIGGNGALNDKLIFADGAVLSNNAKLALNANLNAAIETVTGYDPNTTTPGLRPMLQASALDNVSNLDVSSDIVLRYGESVAAQAGKYIRIVDDGGAGFRGESSNHTQLIAVTDSTQVSIVGGKVRLNPTFDLDLASNYHIEIDAGAFVGQTSGQATEAYNGSSGLNFSTVTPGTGTVVNAVASQAMDSNAAMVAGHNWLDIEGIGSPSSSAVALDLAGGNYALVAKDYDASGGNSSTGYDGIQLGDLNVALNNFALGDLVYIDDQGNNLNALNDLTLSAVLDQGTAPTPIQFAGTSLGGFVEVRLLGSNSSFESINAFTQLVGGTAVITA